MPQICLNDLQDWFVFADPSGGKSRLKRVGARSAIAVVAPDYMGRIFVLTAWAARCPTDEFVDKIFEIAASGPVRQFGIEANAMQSLFADSLAREARHRGLRVPFVDVYQPTKIDKFFRIKTALQPVISAGKLFIQERHLDLRAELAAFPIGQTVDLVDALASAISLVPVQAVNQAKSREAQGLAGYLRMIGTPPAQIDARLAELEKENWARTRY